MIMDLDMLGSGGSGSGLSSGEDNVTLICVERNIRTSSESQFSSALTTSVNVIRIAYFLLFLLGISLNCFVIWLVATHKKLHTLSFGVTLQVIVLDILLSVIHLPIVITSIVGRWVLGKEACVLIGFITYFTGFERTTLILSLWWTGSC